MGHSERSVGVDSSARFVVGDRLVQPVVPVRLSNCRSEVDGLKGGAWVPFRIVEVVRRDDWMGEREPIEQAHHRKSQGQVLIDDCDIQSPSSLHLALELSPGRYVSLEPVHRQLSRLG